MPLLSRLTGLLAVSSVAVLLLLGAASSAGPALGWQLIAIRGGSMEPAIPYGAAVAVRTVAPGTVAVGDVVTVRTSAAVLVTHRVVRIERTGAEARFILHGDANEHPDAVPVAGGALVGRVEGHLPLAGFLLGLLMTPGGLLAAFSWVATLVLVGMAMEQDHETGVARQDATT
jgi:signal peptidase I